jgi:hypothetical protein
MNAIDVSLKEVEILTIRVLDGLHEQKDMDRLSVLLSSSAVARSRYAELVIQDSLLHWETSDVLEFEPSESKTVLFPKVPMVASFAAAILAIFGVWHWKKSTPSPAREVVADTPATLSGKSAVNPENFQTPEQPLTSVASLSTKVGLEVGGDGPFIRSIDARSEARVGIAILEENKRFGEGGIVEIRDDVVVWNREEHLSVPAEQGILPLEGDRMITFRNLESTSRLNQPKFPIRFGFLTFVE